MTRQLVMMSGMVYLAVRDLPKAETAYRRLLELDPNNIDAYSRLGAIYLAQNRLDEANASFEEMAQRPGAQPWRKRCLGPCRSGRTGRPRPESTLRAGDSAQPARGGCGEQPGLGLREQRRQPGSGAAAGADGEGRAAGQRLGHGYARLGLLSEGPFGLAVSTLKEAASQGASNANIHYHLGLAYLKNGNKAEARSTLQQVLKLNPAFPAAADVRRALASIEG